MKAIFFFLLIFCCSCSMERLYSIQQQRRSLTHPYEQMNFIELMRKYMDKEKTGQGSLEGIYSVSSLILKKNKGLFSSVEKEKTVDQKENYAQVAIIRDNARNNREYIEIPIDKKYMPSYSVRGEFTTLSEGNILVLKHFEPKGKVLMYSFAYDQQKEILEGIRTETTGGVTYTYKLTFAKLYPKTITALK
jgi:hypothetical protein